MKKRKMTLIILITLIPIVLIYMLTSFIINRNEEFRASEAKRIGEPIAENKKQDYYSYMESIQGFVESDSKDDKLNLYALSIEKLSEVFENSDKLKYYEQTELGNEYLNKLKEEAVRNLNDSLNYILTHDVEHNNYEYFEKTRDYASIGFYTNDETKHLYMEVDSQYLKQFTVEDNSPTTEEMLKLVLQKGVSEKDIREFVPYSSINVFQADDVEFWSVGDIVLTMKNGYIYDINYSYE